jgi:hypothetical protein
MTTTDEIQFVFFIRRMVITEKLLQWNCQFGRVYATTTYGRESEDWAILGIEITRFGSGAAGCNNKMKTIEKWISWAQNVDRTLWSSLASMIYLYSTRDRVFGCKRGPTNLITLEILLDRLLGATAPAGARGAAVPDVPPRDTSVLDWLPEPLGGMLCFYAKRTSDEGKISCRRLPLVSCLE